MKHQYRKFFHKMTIEVLYYELEYGKLDSSNSIKTKRVFWEHAIKNETFSQFLEWLEENYDDCVIDIEINHDWFSQNLVGCFYFALPYRLTLQDEAIYVLKWGDTKYFLE